MKKLIGGIAAAAVALAATPGMAEDRGSSGHQMQAKGEAQIPHCTKRLGTVAIVEPDNQWWREMNLGRGQVKTADYYLEPDIVSANKNSGGNALGGVLGGVGGVFGGGFGAVLGGINIKKQEANVTLSIVNARTTEEEALVQGYARKSDLSWGAGAGGGSFWGGFGAAGGGGYQDTAIGQIIVLAYLDAYTKLVTQLGGLPDNAAEAAPKAH